MSDYPRLIDWSYFNGTGFFTDKNTKERLTKVYITDPKGEKLLEEGKLACLSSVDLFSMVQDPYFKVVREEGFTTRAKKHGDLRRKMKADYPEIENNVTGTNAKVMDYSEYIYLNVAFLDNHVNSFIKDKDIFFNRHFIYKEYFNKEFLISLIDYRPRAMFGGIIDSYHKEQLPALFSEIKFKFPKLYKEVLNESNWLKDLDKNLSLVGKKAKVQSLLSGDVSVKVDPLKNENFYWDGNVLTNNRPIYDGTLMFQVITPDQDMIVTICDDEVVGENIELVE